MITTTVWHEIFASSNFCDFSSQRSVKRKPCKKKINYRKYFSRKYLTRVNIPPLIFEIHKYMQEIVSVLVCNRMAKKSNIFYWFYTRYAHCSAVEPRFNEVPRDWGNLFVLSNTSIERILRLRLWIVSVITRIS